MSNKQKVIIKQLIAIASFLLIQDILKTIYYTCIVFDFTILAQYLLQDNKTLYYIDNTFHKINKKITFKNYYVIDTKLF